MVGEVEERRAENDSHTEQLFFFCAFRTKKWSLAPLIQATNDSSSDPMDPMDTRSDRETQRERADVCPVGTVINDGVKKK